MNAKALSKIIILPILLSILILLFFIPPKNSTTVWIFIILLSFAVSLFLNIFLQGRLVWYIGLFLGYLLYLLWQQVIGLDLVLYGLLVIMLLEFFFRIQR